MQPKYNLNNKTSALIQQNEEQKRKSRQKLLGSIMLLFIALLVLLYATANVKPIAINPQVVEVKDTTASKSIAASESSNAATAGGISVADTSLESANPAVLLSDNHAPVDTESNSSNNNFKAGVVNSTAKNNVITNNNAPTAQVVKSAAAVIAATSMPETQTSTSQVVQDSSKESKKATLKPVVAPTTKQNVDPSDILNDIGSNTNTHSNNKPTLSNSASNGSVYLQFAALSSIEKANTLQQKLSTLGIHATVQNIQTAKGTLYRLRAGPFERRIAEAQLRKTADEGYSGIITNK